VILLLNLFLVENFLSDYKLMLSDMRQASHVFLFSCLHQSRMAKFG